MALTTSYVLPPSFSNLEKDKQDYHKFDEDQLRPSSANEETKLLAKNESPKKEKEILVDPISLRETITLVPIASTKDSDLFELPLPLLPTKPKFLSNILFNTTNSSPRFSSTTFSKKRRDEIFQASPHLVDGDSSLESPQKETQLRKSKSCTEGRASSALVADEFNPCALQKSHTTKYDEKHFDSYSIIGKGNGNVSIGMSKHNTKNERLVMKTDKEDEDGFKCGALCLFLPGFVKGKIVRATRKEVGATLDQLELNMMSRIVSLEKFECGSWASSALVYDNEDGNSMNLYFDLPLELIRSGVNYAHSPVISSFVFDKDHQKGVLKNNSTLRKSHDQFGSRHVRFSTSPTLYPASPASCITPR